MKKVYACLIGKWICLNDDPNCTIGNSGKDPATWWEEDAIIHAPATRDKSLADSFYGLDYVKISYLGKDYRINPIFIQIVYE